VSECKHSNRICLDNYFFCVIRIQCAVKEIITIIITTMIIEQYRVATTVTDQKDVNEEEMNQIEVSPDTEADNMIITKTVAAVGLITAEGMTDEKINVVEPAMKTDEMREETRDVMIEEKAEVEGVDHAMEIEEAAGKGRHLIVEINIIFLGVILFGRQILSGNKMMVS
jgi:hypothetical protein